jgi:LmbE family N-acetylglucosaminyl deacetylase
MDLVILSPHLDDGVFSLGGLVSRAVAEGAKVTVVTFYTKGPAPPEQPRRFGSLVDYDERLAEDRRALSFLGAHHVWLGYRERFFRSPRPKSPLGVFATPWTVAHPIFCNVESQIDAIAELMEDHREAQFLAPLGIGNHADHVELFLASVSAVLKGEAFERFGFYEDPYVLFGKARSEHFVAARRPYPPAGVPHCVSWQTRAMALVLDRARRGAPVETLLPPAGHQLRWHCAPEPVAPHLGTKLDAMAMYASQLGPLGGRHIWGRMLEGYHRFWDGGEPVWRVSPS